MEAKTELIHINKKEQLVYIQDQIIEIRKYVQVDNPCSMTASKWSKRKEKHPENKPITATQEERHHK